jgi:hypothetical protein
MVNNSSFENDRLLRLFERELDAFHQSFPIMRRTSQAALYAVMAAYDSMLLPLREISAQIDERAIGSRQAMRAIVQSINPALRWITAGNKLSHPKSSTEVDLIDEGGSLLNHARDYLILSAFHVMYSRGLMSVECDEAKKLVRFIRKQSHFPDGFVSAVVAQRAQRQEQFNRPQLISAFNRWLPRVTYQLRDGRIVFKRMTEFAGSEIVEVAKLFAMPETLELADDTDLIGFTMGDFRRFWTALHSWSIAATELYLGLVGNGVAQERCMPTQILTWPEFSTAMSFLAELGPQVISEITHRLTYDTTDQKRDAFLQPLVVSSGWISWCPLLIKQSRPERNMLKLMSRSPTLCNAASTIIGGREGQMLKEIGLRLAKRSGYDYKLNTLIRGGGQSAELDLLAYNRKAPTEILLVEAKAVLAVDDVAEIQAATEQLWKAKRQLERSISILNIMPLERKQSLFPFVDWGRIETYRPLMITPDSSPLGEFTHDAVSVVTLEVFRTQFSNRDLKTPTAIWEACRSKEWLKPFNLDGEDFYSRMKVGSVTYEIPGKEQRL